MGVWIMAARPKTLPAAIVPVAVGGAIGWAYYAFDLIAVCLAGLFAILIQIGTNYANDYFDAKRGADTEARIGPKRAVASGLVTPEQMKRAFILTFLAAFGVGLMLIPFAGMENAGWLVALGIVSIACGIAYTGGPYPLAYHGWGDAFVFVFFGIVAVTVTAFVQIGSFVWPAFWAGCGVGALSVCLLVVNNIRDVEEDRASNKRTLVVRLGRTFGFYLYYLMTLVALLVPFAILVTFGSPMVLLAMMIWPVTMRLRTALQRAKTPGQFDSILAGTAAALLIYGVLLGAGFVLAVEVDLTPIRDSINSWFS